MATITVNGIRLGYHEEGSGPAVIWVHGGFTDRRGADEIVAPLAERYRVITYDRRGHSQSQRVPGRQGLAEQVADLAALIDTLGAAPAHLLSNSDGGEIAVKVAVRDPAAVASLGLHEPSLYGILDGDAEIQPALADLRERLHRVIAELARGHDETAARMLIEGVALGPGGWDAVPEQSRRAFIHNAQTWLEHARDPDYGRIDLAQLAALRVPALVSCGGRSEPVDIAIVARLAAAWPHARRHTFAEAGHVPHRTHPIEYASVALAFIDEVSAPAA